MKRNRHNLTRFGLLTIERLIILLGIPCLGRVIFNVDFRDGILVVLLWDHVTSLIDTRLHMLDMAEDNVKTVNLLSEYAGAVGSTTDSMVSMIKTLTEIVRGRNVS